MRYKSSTPLIYIIALFVVGPTTAQHINELSKLLVGKTVTLKMDMPASYLGVDVSIPDQEINSSSYESRLVNHGISIFNGDTIKITKVERNENSISILLGKGGFRKTETVVAIADETSIKENDQQPKSEKLSIQQQQKQKRLAAIQRANHAQRKMKTQASENEKTKHIALESGSRINLIFKEGTEDEDLNISLIVKALSQLLKY